MTRPLVDYLVARDGPPRPSGLAYDYVLARDGVYVAAESEHLAARVPVARGLVRGLPELGAACTLKHGRLPAAVWRDLLDAARASAARGLEVLLAVAWDPAAGYRTVRPPQVVGAARVRYRPTPGTVLELHSHHALPAYFSRVDDADEQGLRLYGVVGRLDRPRPEAALRVGAYGHRLPLPWEAVFDGDRGRVRDAQFDPPEEDADELPA